MENIILKLKLVVTLLFFLVFLGLGFYYILDSETIRTTPEFKNYELRFRLDTEPSFYVNQFKIYYDFKTNKGNISFSPNANDISMILIEIPRELYFDGDEVILQTRKGDIFKQDEDYTIEIERIPCWDINNTCANSLRVEAKRNISDVDEVTIGINGDSFYPHGTFRMDVTDKTRGGYLHSFMVFDLGNFECAEDCFVDFNSKLGYLKEGEKLWIFTKDKDEIGDRWFILNTINQKNVTKKNVWIALAVTFFVSAFLLLYELAILFVEFSMKIKQNKKIERFLDGKFKIKGIGDKILNKIKKEIEK